MGKKSAKAPDTKGAAETQGRYARETARDTTYADRPDQFNPFGSVQWSTEAVRDPSYMGTSADPAEVAKWTKVANGGGWMAGVAKAKLAELTKGGEDPNGGMVTKWTQRQTLTPELQGTLDNTLGFMNSKSKLAAGMAGRIQDEMGSTPEWDQFGDVVGFDPNANRKSAEDAMYGKATSRLDPQYQKMAQDLEISLRNKGLRPGDQAYDAQMASFGNQRTDAYEQARMDSVLQGQSEFGLNMQGNERANALRSQQIQEYLAKRGFSLGEANALQAGQTPQDIAAMVTGG